MYCSITRKDFLKAERTLGGTANANIAICLFGRTDINSFEKEFIKNGLTDRLYEIEVAFEYVRKSYKKETLTKTAYVFSGRQFGLTPYDKEYTSSTLYDSDGRGWFAWQALENGVKENACTQSAYDDVQASGEHGAPLIDFIFADKCSYDILLFILKISIKEMAENAIRFMEKYCPDTRKKMLLLMQQGEYMLIVNCAFARLKFI